MTAIPFTSVRFDQASPTVFYVGKAAPGKTDEEQAWQIVRYTQTATTIKSEYAGEAGYSYHRWTDRLSLDYT